jgi:hypothetical protein
MLVIIACLASRSYMTRLTEEDGVNPAGCRNI